MMPAQIQFRMSDDDIPPPKFSGRTYSRSRKSAASRASDDNKTAYIKAATTMPNWGKASYTPVLEGVDGISESKKVRIDSKVGDPFSFDTADKWKVSPVKREETTMQEQELRTSVRPPDSRIAVKGNDCEEYMKAQKEEAICAFSRTSPKNPIIMDHFVEVERKIGQNLCYSEARLTVPQDFKKNEEEYDDIFPIKFKRNSLKTSGKVVTPVDKRKSSPPRQSEYNVKGPKGRRPLTVSGPGLIEDHKRSYAANQLKGKPDAAIKGLDKGSVVSKQELADEHQGATVVCKPKAEQEKGKEQTKCFIRNSKLKGSLVQLASNTSASQEEMPRTNVSNFSTSTTPTGKETISTRASARLRNVSLVRANSSEAASSPSGSASSVLSQPSTKRVPRGSDCSVSNAESVLSSQSSVSSDNNSQNDESLSRGGKRYRIFKSRASQVEEELKPPVFKRNEESEKPPLLSSRHDMNASGDSQVSFVVADETVFGQVDLTIRGETHLRSGSLPSRSVNSSQTSYSTESTDVVELDLDAVNIKHIDSSAARVLLAAHLRNIEKGNDSDSTDDPDSVSEFSEPPSSQETPSNSQNSLDGGSHKDSSAGATRKFFKSKKSPSGSSDLQRRIFGSSPQKVAGKTRKKENDDVVLIKNPEKGPKLKRVVHWPERKYDEAYTSLKVSRTHKELYTVVRNVRQTHEVQELGETKDFMYEVDYLLDSLRNTNTTAIRCLSCLKLASKCISPVFRMHLRAHGTVSKIFNLLNDACSNSSLALSTSAMMFVLSRDRLSMDLDHDSLNLMLRLNEVDASDKASLDLSNLPDLEKTKQKVKELLAQLQQETHAREIDLGFVSTGNLALESLLSLTSRRAGEWFKEELRTVGGLDHIVDSVKFCEKNLPEDLSQDIQNALPVLRKLDRCLRVLENISYKHRDNQNYLILYQNALLLQACTRTLRLCLLCMPTYKLLENLDENKSVKELPGYTILTCMLDVLRVMLNITHANQLGNLDVADETSLMETVVRCLTTTLWCIPVEQSFDLAMLCLGLLINLVEHRRVNRTIMMNMKTQVKYTERSQPKTMSAVKAVVELFVQKEQAAREMEENTESSPDASVSESANKSGEWKETDTSIQWITSGLKEAKEEQEKQKKAASGAAKGEYFEADEGNQSILEDDEETFTKALHKAGKHMENSFVASYAGLLLGCIIIGNKEYTASVKKLFPDNDLCPMIKMLKKFCSFMSLATAVGITNTDVSGITKVIEVLESA